MWRGGWPTDAGGDGGLRSITFWLFGSLANAHWYSPLPLLITPPLVLLLTRSWGPALDQYQLGDREASTMASR